MNLRAVGRFLSVVVAVFASVFGTPITFAADRSPPSAPSSLSACVAADGVVTVSWNDNSSNEAGFRVIREVASGDSWFASSGVSIGADVASYREVPLPGTYRYK